MTKEMIPSNPGLLESLDPQAIGSCNRRASSQIYLRAVNYDSQLRF